MYYIYSDEAGISANEPVTVVVGIIAHADRHWRAASDALERVLDAHVPDKLRPGFIFHGKHIWAGYRADDISWPRERRAQFIGEVAAIPRSLGMAVSLGRVRRDWHFPIDTKVITLPDFHHVIAFGRCMARANKYIRDWSEPTEVATVVAEDTPGKRRFLKKALRAPPVYLPLTPEYIIPDHNDRAAGIILQTNTGAVDRIIDTVHFVEKGEAPLLQLADACAFSFRRYFASQSYGPEIVNSMIGENLVWDDWQGPISDVVFRFNPNHQHYRPV